MFAIETIEKMYEKMTNWKIAGINKTLDKTLERSRDPRKLYIKIDNSRQLEFQTFISKYNFETVEIIDYNKTTDKIQYMIYDPDLDFNSLANDLIDIFWL